MADEALNKKEKEKLKEIYKEANLKEVTIKPEPYTCGKGSGYIPRYNGFVKSK